MTHPHRNPSLRAGLTAGELTALLGFAESHLGETRHERRVMRIASVLFDLTRDLHGLVAADRSLLKAASLLHDVGRCAGADDHHRHGAEMILRARSLGLDATDRAAIAFLTRYHRGTVPDRRRDAEIDPGIEFQTARVLAGLLRAADALDGRRVPPPTLVFRRMGSSLHVTCHADADGGEAHDVFGRRKKYRLLEEMLGISVRVTFPGTRPPQAFDGMPSPRPIRGPGSMRTLAC